MIIRMGKCHIVMVALLLVVPACAQVATATGPASGSARVADPVLSAFLGTWSTSTKYLFESGATYSGSATVCPVANGAYVLIAMQHGGKEHGYRERRIVGREAGQEGYVMFVCGSGGVVPVKLQGTWDPQSQTLRLAGQAVVVSGPPTDFKCEAVLGKAGHLEIRDYSSLVPEHIPGITTSYLRQ